LSGIALRFAAYALLHRRAGMCHRGHRGRSRGRPATRCVRHARSRRPGSSGLRRLRATASRRRVRVAG